MDIQINGSTITIDGVTLTVGANSRIEHRGLLIKSGSDGALFVKATEPVNSLSIDSEDE